MIKNINHIVDYVFNDLIIARFVINVDKQKTDFVILYCVKYLFSRLFILEIFER